MTCITVTNLPEMTKPQSTGNAMRFLTSNASECEVADAKDNTVSRSYKFRLLPSRRQHLALAEILESQRVLYNAAKQEREDCFRKTGKGRTFFQQSRALTELRKDNEYSGISRNLQAWTLKQLDNAYAAYFRRIKEKTKSGAPRYKGKGRWNSFGFLGFAGITLKGSRLRFKGFPGTMRIHFHRQMPEGQPLRCIFNKDHKGWSVCFIMRVEKDILPVSELEIGMDVGIENLCVLSTGEMIPNLRLARNAQREVARKQRALSRCKTGSHRRTKIRTMLTRRTMRIKNSRRTYLHQVSSRLIRNYGKIAIEDLNVRGMAAGMLGSHVLDASWGMLREFITYKAESAGRTVSAVDPRRTSQECSGCGKIVKKELSERTHKCSSCGLTLNRDHNAALNILSRAECSPGARKTRRWPVSAPRSHG